MVKRAVIISTSFLLLLLAALSDCALAQTIPPTSGHSSKMGLKPVSSRHFSGNRRQVKRKWRRMIRRKRRNSHSSSKG